LLLARVFNVFFEIGNDLFFAISCFVLYIELHARTMLRPNYGTTEHRLPSLHQARHQVLVGSLPFPATRMPAAVSLSTKRITMRFVTQPLSMFAVYPVVITALHTTKASAGAGQSMKGKSADSLSNAELF